MSTIPAIVSMLQYTSQLVFTEYILLLQNLEFEGIMRFYFQSTTREAQQKVATKCIRVSNTANTNSVIEALVQKFRPDLRMLTNQSSYALYEVHSNEGESWREFHLSSLPYTIVLTLCNSLWAQCADVLIGTYYADFLHVRIVIKCTCVCVVNTVPRNIYVERVCMFLHGVELHTGSRNIFSCYLCVYVCTKIMYMCWLS